MRKIKKQSNEVEDPRIQFYADVEAGKLSLLNTVRAMRKIWNLFAL